MATTTYLLSGFSIGRMNSSTVNVSHLLFVDDAIIFCDDNCEQMVNLQCVLIWFEVCLAWESTWKKKLYITSWLIQLLVGVWDAELIVFLLSFLVSLLEQNSRKSPFGKLLWKGSKEGFHGRDQDTFLREED